MSANKEQCIHACVCWHYNGDGLIVPCEPDCAHFEEAVKTIAQQANHKICTCRVLEHVDYSRKAVVEIDRFCPSHGVQTS